MLLLTVEVMAVCSRVRKHLVGLADLKGVTTSQGEPYAEAHLVL